MSYETTIARAKAQAAEHEWKDHRTHCPQCSLAGSPRNAGLRCREGAQLRMANSDYAAALAREQELDKKPTPGQGALPILIDEHIHYEGDPPCSGCGYLKPGGPKL